MSLAALRRRLADAGVTSPEAEAWAMLEAATGRSRLELLTSAPPDDDATRAALEAWIARRAAGEPLQHLLGRAAFGPLTLTVDPRAMIPRPETEGLVALALRRLEGASEPRVLDVGTGSGAIALALAHDRPDAAVWAVEVDEEALALARLNGARLGLPVRFLAGDLLSPPALRTVLETLDLLVANPPYLPDADRDAVSPEVRRDPEGALYAGSDGLAVWRRLEGQARARLRRGARMLVELDPRNVGVAAAEAQAAAWREVRVHPDLAGRDRVLELLR